VCQDKEMKEERVLEIQEILQISGNSQAQTNDLHETYKNKKRTELFLFLYDVYLTTMSSRTAVTAFVSSRTTITTRMTNPRFKMCFSIMVVFSARKYVS